MTATTADHRSDDNNCAEVFAAFRVRTQSALFSAMPAAIDRLGWNHARLEERQGERLRELLTIAKDRSPFYARRLRGIDPATFELKDLPRIPVMTKAEMMANFDDVVTDRRLTRGAVEHTVAETGAVPRPIAGEFVILASGGASGERGLFAFDPPAFAEFASTIIRPSVARGPSAGGRGPGGPSIAFVAAASPIHATGAAPCVLEGSPIQFVPVPVTLPLDTVVARLNELQPALLYGYASMLARLAHEQQAGRLRIAPMAVTSTSETLRDDLRRTIRDGFGVPIVNVYGSSEGLVGVSPPDDPVLTFATDACIIELVDEHDHPVAPLTPSSSILVTNLYNTVQPLIRYRIEDRFISRPEAADHGHLLAEVQGRSAEVLRFGGLTVHPLVIATPLTKHRAVIDYQVRQMPTGVHLDVVARGRVDTDELAANVAGSLTAAGLSDAAVTVRTVESLDRDPKTGKLATFVPMP